MAAAKRRRRRLDFYPSSDWAARVLYRRCPGIQGIAEPCVGEGDLIKGRDDVRWTNDVDPAREATYHVNVAHASAWDALPRVPWHVTNPPFNQALAILTNALEHAELGVAFLLRMTFLEPTTGTKRAPGRAHWLVRNPPQLALILPRYSFTSDGGTDSVTCVWYLWTKPAGRDLVPSGIQIVPRAVREGGDDQ